MNDQANSPPGSSSHIVPVSSGHQENNQQLQSVGLPDPSKSLMHQLEQTTKLTADQPIIHLQPKKQIVKKYGIAHAIFQPLAIGAAMLMGVYLSVSFAMNFWHGYKRDIAYSQTRHIDKTALDFFQSSMLSKDRVELVIRNYDGILEKRLASNSQLSAYIRARSSELDLARAKTITEMQSEISKLFETAFEGSDKDINAYADWFFEWKRPYVILKEALSSTTTRLIKLGEYESLRTAVERDMKDYFMRHYKEQVLKPEKRDNIIVAGIEKIARAAHGRYLAQMTVQDVKMRAFLAKNTTYLATIPKDKSLTDLKLDWDAQRWQAPTYQMEDRAFDSIAGLGRVAVGGTVGALAIGPAVNRGMSGIFSSLSRRFASSMGARITLAEGGALAGTAVEPVGGTIVGAAIGVALGFAADYVANKLNEKFSRGQFVEANKQALASTTNLWQKKLDNNLQAAFNRWYDEAKAGLVLVREDTYLVDKDLKEKIRQPNEALVF